MAYKASVLGLNWLTSHDAGPAKPSVTYDITSSRALTASRLTQLLTQIDRWLGCALAAGQLGHDLGEYPAAAIDAATAFLSDARLSAAALAGDLNQAPGTSWNLNLDPDRDYGRAAVAGAARAKSTVPLSVLRSYFCLKPDDRLLRMA